MAFNLHLPGSDMFHHMSWLSKEFLKRRQNQMLGSSLNYCTMYDYKQKIGYSTPTLCFQSDVMYPNALAAASNISCEEDRCVMGCKGNQIQKDFSLEPRVPVALPLIQYPSNVSESGQIEREIDVCAKPVLNWEKHMQNLKSNVRYNYLLWPRKRTKKDSRLPVVRRKVTKQPRDNVTGDSDPESRFKKPMSKDGQDEGHESDLELSSDDNQQLHPQPSTSSSCAKDVKINRIKISRKDLVKKVFRSTGNVEAHERVLNRIQRMKETKDLLAQGKKWKRIQKPDLSKFELVAQPRTAATKQKIVLASVNKFKNIPTWRVEGTWNHLHGGLTGACCVVDSPVNKSKSLYVAHQSQLRKAALEKSTRLSMLSYKLKSVWEEDLPNECFDRNNIIFQIVPARNFDMLGVRRGKSIGIYSIENECPYLLDSIPNIGYGTTNYEGWNSANNRIKVCIDPMLLGFDFNPQYTPEFITIDENRQIRVCDITKGKTISSYGLAKSSFTGPAFKNFPNLQKINNAAGCSFSTYGQVFFGWSDSKVSLGDRRDRGHSRANLMDILNLRESTSSLSWSSQTYFNDSKPELNDYISSLRKSNKEYYYYVGTTTRIILMDLRVPGQPVLQMEHGMGSAATCLDTYANESFEVVVAAGQRLSKTFCGITDHAHVSCANRPSCEAKNPVLNCLPKHLSNSREFFDTAFTEGFGLSWEAEHRRARNHNYAWTTGLAVDKGLVNKNELKPPGVLIFTTNCFGDIFFQEWEQGPMEPCRKTSLGDSVFTEFMEQWRDSMRSKSIFEFQKPSLNPKTFVDCSLVLEPCARSIERMTNVRNKPFDPYKPNEIQDQFVKKTQIPFKDRISQLRKNKSALINRLLDVWETQEDVSVDEVEAKQEEDEMQRRYENNINDDGTYDVENISATVQETEELIELEDQMQNELQEENLLMTMTSKNEDANNEPLLKDGDESDELLSILSGVSGDKAEASDQEFNEHSDDSDSRDIDSITSKASNQEKSAIVSPSRLSKYFSKTQKKPSTALPCTSRETRTNHDCSPLSTSSDEDDHSETMAKLAAQVDEVEENNSYPTSSRSPELWSQLYNQDYYGSNEAQPDNAYQESYENRDRQQTDNEEYRDFIPASQPKNKHIFSRRSGF